LILIDTNLLLFATFKATSEHERARRWLDEQFESSPRIGLPWHSLLGFVRLASNLRIFRNGPSADQSWRVVREWLSAGNVWVPQPTERHADVLDQLFSSASVDSRSVMDTHLAALAIEHGLVLCSADTDFTRFPSLRWLNPLVA
jgi:toxin-antitoxin system PIN domain toxin